MGAGAAAAAGLGGKALGAFSDILGGNMAKDRLLNGLSDARTDLTKGYTEGKGYQQPIYDKALGAYSNLSDKYASGGFSNPHMDPYHQDPNAVFQDPEYQAQMRAGTDAIDNSAQAKGMLFSGAANRDLTKFGQDTFAGRSDALYKRGFDATSTAFDQNARTNAANFTMGSTLMSPLTGTASNLTNLATGEGSVLADNDMNRANVKAGNILNTSNSLGGLARDAGGMGMDYLSGGMPKVFQPKSALLTGNGAGMSNLA